jgi:hypothetical protein
VRNQRLEATVPEDGRRHEVGVPAVDASSELFAVMRATFWSAGEELLQGVVRALADVLQRTAVVAESVTPARDGRPASLGLWIAGPAARDRDFHYDVIPAPSCAAWDDCGQMAHVTAALEHGHAPLRGVGLRSPTGRPLGHLLIAADAASATRFDATLMDAILLAPLAARAGMELTRLPAPGARKAHETLVHMCAWCKSVRDTRRVWHPVEDYIRTLADTEFTHGICPDCSRHA